MLKRLFVICSAIVLSACATSPVTGDGRVNSFTLPHRGELRLSTPADWQNKIVPSEKGIPATIVFRPAEGKAFQVIVTPIAPTVGTAEHILNQSELRDLIERARKDAAPQAVEKNIVIHELHGANVNGYYFTATDKTPGSGPDDYRVMTHFEVIAGHALLMGTALYNDDSGKVRDQTIAMLKSAQFKPGEQGEAQDRGDASGASLKVSKVADGYSLTVPASRVEVILHGSKLEQQAGGSPSPSYFYFEDKGRGAIISGWFDSANNFPGIKPFWKNESDSIKEHQPPGPVNVKIETVGEWQVVTYEIRLPGANWGYAHMRAERVQAGTWVDLHLSIPAKLPYAKAHAKLLEVLKSIEVKEKAK